MVAIYASAVHERAEQMREELRSCDIPCALIGPGYASTLMVHKVPFLIVAENIGACTESFLRRVPPEKLLSWSEDVPASLAVRTALRNRRGIDLDHLERSGIQYSRGEIFHHGARVHLTPNERRILNLLLISPGTYFFADEIAEFCLRDASADAVPVHICNINKKCLADSMFKPIECRRYRGYRIV